MSSKVRIELNSKNINAFLRSAQMKEMISERAADIASRCGSGYEYRIHDSGQRIIANVYPATDEARQDNLDNNTVLKALR